MGTSPVLESGSVHFAWHHTVDRRSRLVIGVGRLGLGNLE